jgi:hypothetical protein
MVQGQLGFSWLELRARLTSLSQEELDWEPGPGALSVVRELIHHGAEVMVLQDLYRAAHPPGG